MIAQLAHHPEMALFLALAVGYLIGGVKVGPVQLGGVCGTLIVALILGQSGVRLDPDLKNIAFALFIFALGFTGGPQFFANIRQGWRFGILSLVEVIVVMAVVLGATVLLSLNPGAAAGLLAGSATESAVIGTAAEAVTHLPIPAEEAVRLQGQIATAYSVTYLVGLITIVLFTSQFAPLLMRIDLKKEAAALAARMGGGDGTDEQALPDFVGRAFSAGPAAGGTVSALETRLGNNITVERILRGERAWDAQPTDQIESDDLLLVVGRREAVIAATQDLGAEADTPSVFAMPLVRRDVAVGVSQAVGRTVRELREFAPLDIQRGIFISRIRRLGHDVPVLPETKIERGDVVELYGAERAVRHAAPELGRLLEPSDKTDFIMVGVGVLVGILIGMLGVTIAGVRISLGSGGGCLLSGLVFGWLATRSAGLGNFPSSAAQILKDFGLATFIAAVGLSAGPDAIRLIREYGATLPIAGILAALLPAICSLFIGRRLLKIEPPFLLGAIAGQQCSTPAISAVVATAGNSTPVVGYTVTYAISNVLLPLLGPIVVGVAAKLG
jgi:putative transport protein